MGNVNEDYALGIVQINNRLEIVREELPSSSFLLSELREMIKNDNKTVMDMQNHYNLCIKTIDKYFNYILPYDYTSSYVYGISEPNISFADYQKLLNERISQVNAGNYEEKKNRANRAIKEARYSNYSRFLRCYNFYLACNKIKEKYDWKMISSESIGWTGYEYPIDQDFVVHVSSNFGYGYASYFHLIVIYKDIIIAPYSYLIKYYKANMVQICNCTRAYTVVRDNWEEAFEFVRDFVNHGKENPASFAKKYIMKEVNDLVSGLVRIMQSPESEVQQKINDMEVYSKEYRSLTFIYHMPNEDKQYFEINREEFGVVYKSEKISCGLDVLNSLKSVSSILPEVEASIEQIKNLNYLLVPEITTLSNTISQEIEIFNSKIEQFDDQLGKLEKDKKPYYDQCIAEWKTVQKEKPYLSFFMFETKFSERYPLYKDLNQKSIEIKNQKDDVENRKRNRLIIKERLDKCLYKIKDYFAG